MKTLGVALVAAALAVAGTSWIGFAQESQSDRGGTLRKVAAADAFDREAWRERLTDPDLDRREEGFGELVRAARGDREAQEALREWARGTGELAWTARLALREAERASDRLRPRRPGMDLGPFGGLDVFRSGADPFEDARRRMEELLEELGTRDPLAGMAPFLGGRSESRSHSMRVTPEGVEVEIEETGDDGETTRKTYRAESLEELYAAHPELRQRLDVDVQEGPFGAFPGFGDPFGRLRRPLVPDRLERAPLEGGLFDGEPLERSDRLRKADDEVTRTDVLGVYLAEPSDAELRSGADDLGPEVQSVVGGTIASALGLGPGDVLLSLNGVRLLSVEDVRRALGERLEDEDVTLRLRTAAGDVVTRVWSPAAER